MFGRARAVDVVAVADTQEKSAQSQHKIDRSLLLIAAEKSKIFLDRPCWVGLLALGGAVGSRIVVCAKAVSDADDCR